MVICADGMNTWRKQYFPEYKANRKKRRDATSNMDWPEIFRILTLVREEIRENLPYKVLHMEGCEADDIIGALVYETQEFGKHQPCMIVSSDKDFIQLQKYNNVKQFSPIQKKVVVDKNPRQYTFEHICRGDPGDGVPNVLSPDNCFTDGLKQTPLRKTVIDFWVDNLDNMPEEIKRNYQRNKTLIDLSEIPRHIYNSIIQEYDSQIPAMRMKVLTYLINKRCKNLIEVVEEFYNG
jgi:hypothetical protein